MQSRQNQRCNNRPSPEKRKPDLVTSLSVLEADPAYLQQVMAHPAGSRPAILLGLQRRVGNRAMGRILRRASSPPTRRPGWAGSRLPDTQAHPPAPKSIGQIAPRLTPKIPTKLRSGPAVIQRNTETSDDLLQDPKKAKGSRFAKLAGGSAMTLLGMGTDLAATGGYIASNVGGGILLNDPNSTVGNQLSQGAAGYSIGLSGAGMLVGGVQSLGASIEAHQQTLNLKHGRKLSKEGGAAGKLLGKRMRRHGRWGLGEKSLAAASGWTNTASGVPWAVAGGYGATGNADLAASGSIAGAVGGGLNAVGGVLQVGSEGTGLVRQIKAWMAGSKRRKQAKKFAKQTTDQGLQDIAKYTAKTQKRGGRGFGVGKSILNLAGGLFRTTAGALNVVSAGASISDNPFLSLLASALATGFGGLGILTSGGAMGLGKLEDKYKKRKDTLENSPDNTDPTAANADKLIGILTEGVNSQEPESDSRLKDAGSFLTRVLKINVMKDDDANTIDVEKVQALLDDDKAFRRLLIEKMDKTR